MKSKVKFALGKKPRLEKIFFGPPNLKILPTSLIKILPNI